MLTTSSLEDRHRSMYHYSLLTFPFLLDEEGVRDIDPIKKQKFDCLNIYNNL